MTRIEWPNVVGLGGVDFTCAFCDRDVSADKGWFAQNPDSGNAFSPLGGYRSFFVAICPRCGNPTYVRGPYQIPGVRFGDPVEHLPDDVAALYDEARDSVSHGNFTAATMVGRKLLMNVAVAKDAPPGETFQAYVKHLLDAHVVTPDMEPWVDQIRQVGNVANHEIPPIAKDEAEDLVTFVGMLLKVVYEYPGRHHAALDARAAREAASDS